MNISIIGCGKMGGAMAKRLATTHKISLYDHHFDKACRLAEEIGAVPCKTPVDAVSGSEIIVLAVKPRDLETVADAIHREIYKEQLLVSVLAGISTEVLEKHFSEIPLLRAMPNMAVSFGAGVVGLADTGALSSHWKARVNAAFAPLGALHWIKEHQIDAITALTGAGPAFMYVIIESIIDAGVSMGLTAAHSRQLALELIEGVRTTMKEDGRSPSDLKWEITSPGGTTIQGVKAMEDHGVRSGIINTFLASYHHLKGD